MYFTGELISAYTVCDIYKNVLVLLKQYGINCQLINLYQLKYIREVSYPYMDSAENSEQIMNILTKYIMYYFTGCRFDPFSDPFL